MEYKKIEELLETSTKDLDITELEEFRRMLNLQVTRNRKIWSDILKKSREEAGYFAQRENMDYKDREAQASLHSKEQQAQKMTEEAAKKKLLEFTEAICQGLMSGGKARWWWSKDDDIHQVNKPTKISNEAKELAHLMLRHSFWWPLKEGYLCYVGVRDFVAALVSAAQNAEYMSQYDKMTTEEYCSVGLPTVSIYDEFLSFYRTRDSIEKEYREGEHCGDCIKMPCSCQRCQIDDARRDAEDCMHRMGWI